MAEINNNSVENLINNLSNLTVPQLLKWMIVNIPINDLNECLRNIGADVSLGGQSSTSPPRPRFVPGSPPPPPPDSPFASPPESPFASPPSAPSGGAGGSGVVAETPPPGNNAQMVYDVIKASKNTKKTPLVVLPSGMVHYLDGRIMKQLPYSEYLEAKAVSKSKKGFSWITKNF